MASRRELVEKVAKACAYVDDGHPLGTPASNWRKLESHEKEPYRIEAGYVLATLNTAGLVVTLRAKPKRKAKR